MAGFVQKQHKLQDLLCLFDFGDLDHILKVAMPRNTGSKFYKSDIVGNELVGIQGLFYFCLKEKKNNILVLLYFQCEDAVDMYVPFILEMLKEDINSSLICMVCFIHSNFCLACN